MLFSYKAPDTFMGNPKLSIALNAILLDISETRFPPSGNKLNYLTCLLNDFLGKLSCCVVLILVIFCLIFNFRMDFIGFLSW